MRTPFLLVTATAVLLLAALPAQAKLGIQNPDTPTPTTLYLHMINVQDMPINTQVPNDEFSDTGTWGATQMTLKCLHPLTGDVQGTGHGTGGSTSQSYHTSRGYSSPSYVEYDFRTADNVPRTHPERGISYDAIFDKEAPFYLKWYVATYNGGSSGQEADQDQAPTPVPGVVVKATMKTGDAISVDDRSYDEGVTIAEGQTEPAVLVPKHGPDGVDAGPGPQTFPQPGEHPQVKHVGFTPGGSNVYEFNVTMTPEVDLIQRATGFNLRIDMYIDNEQLCAKQDHIDGEYLMSPSVVPYTSADTRPRLVLSIMNPIRLEYLHPQFVGDDLVVHTALNSAWGNYDVDEDSGPDEGGIRVAIDGPSAATSLDVAAFVQRTHEHYHHQEAVDVTYLWAHRADRAVDGLYTVTVAFENDQHTARATGTAQFEIGKNRVIGCGNVQEASQTFDDECVETVLTQDAGAADAPGLPLAGALAALAAVGAIARRRKA